MQTTQLLCGYCLEYFLSCDIGVALCEPDCTLSMSDTVQQHFLALLTLHFACQESILDHIFSAPDCLAGVAYAAVTATFCS